MYGSFESLPAGKVMSVTLPEVFNHQGLLDMEEGLDFFLVTPKSQTRIDELVAGRQILAGI